MNVPTFISGNIQKINFITMKKNISFLFLYLTVHLSCKPKSLQIIPIKELTETDSMYNTNNSLRIVRVDRFILSGNATRDVAKRKIDAFVKINQDFKVKYFQYEMYFYKESKHASLSYIHEYPGNLRYKALQDEEPICSYKWINGKLLGVFEGF
jgi:hypothetical protein